MYTFPILALFFLLLSGVIFGKKIKQNQFLVGLIVFAGTLVGSVVVNGILGLSIPYTSIEVRTKHLKKHHTEITTPTDTIEFYSYIEFDYNLEKGEEHPDMSVVDICLAADIYNYQSGKLSIKFLPEGDSIPYVSIRREKRITDSKWITSFGLPNGEKSFIAYIPNDSIHNVLVNQLNEKFFKNEKDEIAKLN